MLDGGQREVPDFPRDRPAGFLGEEIYRVRDEHGWILVYQKGELKNDVEDDHWSEQA